MYWAILFWGRSRSPRSMGLVYLPTYTIPIGSIMVGFDDKCRYTYHTWILWDTNRKPNVGRYPLGCDDSSGVFIFWAYLFDSSGWNLQ